MYILKDIMMKQKQTSYQPSSPERTALIVCASIVVAFVLLVAIATSGSLFYYTIPHLILALILIGALFFLKALPKMAVRFLVILAIIGAVVAIGLTLAYLPYYSQYLDYVKRIES